MRPVISGLQDIRPCAGSTQPICKLSAHPVGVLGGKLAFMTLMQQPDESSELDSTALLEVATQAGTAISDRMLETFRAQGLILRPQRVGYRGRAPMWLYPAGTDRQLLCLLRWRRQTKDPDTLKVLLWLDGFLSLSPTCAKRSSATWA